MDRTGVALLACLGFAVLGVSSVHAQEKFATFSCGVLNVDSDGNVQSPKVKTGRAVFASNPGGNVLMKCEAQLEARPSKALVLTYNSPSVTAYFKENKVACPYPTDSTLEDGDVTYNWTQVIRPNGETTLTCRGNPSSEAKENKAK